MADSLKGAWDGFKDWLVENADTLSNVSSALAVAALAVNAIPVVGQVASAVLGTASALCAAGAMAGHWMDNARGGKSSGWKIGLDALGVIPVVGGPAKAAIGGIKGVAKGAGVAAKAKGGLSGLTNARAVGREIYEGVENPLSTKAINAGLTKAFGTGAPPAAITGFVKTTSLVTHQVTGGSETQAQAAPTGGKFHKALAA
jgi:hypothetical protein